MNAWLKNIANLFLALLVLITSLGFTLNKHYCGGELRNIAINKNVELCAMCQKVANLPDCHKQEKESKPCCENEKDEVKPENYNVSQKVELDNNQLFFIAYTYVILDNIHNVNTELESEFIAPSPPLIERDIPIAVQSFLL